MNVLVTGATGFLGSHVCRRLAADGHTITVLRRERSPATHLEGLAVRHELGEVTDVTAVARAVAGQDVVIHAAAGVSGSPARATSYRVNVAGTSAVVDACLEHRVRRLLHVSSVAAIGIPTSPTPADERFAFNLADAPIHYHGSKHEAERVVLAGVARGLDAVIVNPSTVWGRFGDRYRGADVLHRVAGAKRLFYTPGGVCIAHVDDVVAGIVSAVQRGESGERYILGGDNMSFREWMTKLAAAIGERPRMVGIPGIIPRLAGLAARSLVPAGDRFHAIYLRAFFAHRYTFYDSAKAEQALGYRHRGFDAIAAEGAAALGLC
jgi:dihydroflavonol-4-reductase